MIFSYLFLSVFFPMTSSLPQTLQFTSLMPLPHSTSSAHFIWGNYYFALVISLALSLLTVICLTILRTFTGHGQFCHIRIWSVNAAEWVLHAFLITHQLTVASFCCPSSPHQALYQFYSASPSSSAQFKIKWLSCSIYFPKSVLLVFQYSHSTGPPLPPMT